MTASERSVQVFLPTIYGQGELVTTAEWACVCVSEREGEAPSSRLVKSTQKREMRCGGQLVQIELQEELVYARCALESDRQ